MVTYGCYPSIPHALRFTKGCKGLMPHPVYYALLHTQCTFLHNIMHITIQNITRYYTEYYTPLHYILHTNLQLITHCYATYYTLLYKILHTYIQHNKKYHTI